MSWFVEGLRHNPELAIFLTLALGFLIGKLKIGGFSFGTVVGTLLAGVLVGPAQHPGPRHRQDRLLRPVPLHDRLQGRAPVLPGPEEGRPLPGRWSRSSSASRVSWPPSLAAKVLGYDMGTAAGLLAGAFSESTVIGTAGDAINRLAHPGRGEGAPRQQHPRRLCGHVPGRHGRPRLVPSHDRAQAHGGQPPGRGQEDAERRAAGAAEAEPGVASAARRFDVRAYRVTNDALVNKTVGELEALPRDFRVFILRVRRQGALLEAEPTTVIRRDDVVAVATRLDAPRGAGRRDRTGGPGPGAARHPDRGAGRGGHEQGAGREEPGRAGERRVRPRRLPAEARAGRRGDAGGPRDARRPG